MKQPLAESIPRGPVAFESNGCVRRDRQAFTDPRLKFKRGGLGLPVFTCGSRNQYGLRIRTATFLSPPMSVNWCSIPRSLGMPCVSSIR